MNYKDAIIKTEQFLDKIPIEKYIVEPVCDLAKVMYKIENDYSDSLSNDEFFVDMSLTGWAQMNLPLILKEKDTMYIQKLLKGFIYYDINKTSRRRFKNCCWKI